MNNKFYLTILAICGLAAAHTAKATTFVDVATLGDGVSVATTGGTIKVDATVLTKNQRWTRDRVYILANTVIIPSGITLTVEAGTLIRAEQVWRQSAANGTAEAASTPADPGALVCAQGGRLNMLGTADAPVIITSMDDVNVPGGFDTVPYVENKGKVNGLNNERILRQGGTSVGTLGVGTYEYSGGTLTPTAKNYSKTWGAESAFRYEGLWGGIVMCGKATVNKGYASAENANSSAVVLPTIHPTTGVISGTSKGVQAVEGMAGFSSYAFGGGDQVSPPDDSGNLTFVSNCYGGYVIAVDVELNSYSFYGVGRGTNLCFLEATNNADDDYEFWGGDVSGRWLLSMWCGDDGVDTDQGFLGTFQNVVQIQNNGNGAADGTTLSGRSTSNYGDSGTENDGPESSNTAVPYSTYIMSNMTLIGRGYAAAASWSSLNLYSGPNFKDNAGARWHNSLIMDFPGGAVHIAGRATVGTDAAAAEGSSEGRFNAIRSTGGFDGAGRSMDFTTTVTGPSDAPDGRFNNCWFYRDGLAKGTAFGSDGKYLSKAAFDTAYNNGAGAAGWDTANDANLFPVKYDRNGRGVSADLDQKRCNAPSVVAQIKLASNYNVFNQNPGVIVNPYTRISGMDLRITDSAARSLANSSIPSVRGLNSGETFVGAVRDNMWMRGWTLADKLGAFAGSQIVPDVTIAVNASSQPVVTFGGEAGVKYVIEVSTDNKNFTPVTTVLAVAGNNPYTDAARTVGAAPIYYRVIAL